MQSVPQHRPMSPTKPILWATVFIERTPWRLPDHQSPRGMCGQTKRIKHSRLGKPCSVAMHRPASAKSHRHRWGRPPKPEDLQPQQAGTKQRNGANLRVCLLGINQRYGFSPRTATALPYQPTLYCDFPKHPVCSILVSCAQARTWRRQAASKSRSASDCAAGTHVVGSGSDHVCQDHLYMVSTCIGQPPRPVSRPWWYLKCLRPFHERNYGRFIGRSTEESHRSAQSQAEHECHI